MSDQPFETGPAAVACRKIGSHKLEAFAEAAHRRQQSGCHRRRYRVERLDGTGDGVWPPVQVSCLCGRTLVCGRVLAVVASEVKIQQVDQGVPSVDLDHGERGTRSRLRSGQVRLVMRIWLESAASERCEESLYSSWREVLDLAVELVQPRELAGFGHVELPDRTKPVGDHMANVAGIGAAIAR